MKIAVPNCGPAPLVVEFDATGAVDGFDYYSNTEWDFGDGTYAYGLTATHTYETPGDYMISFSFYGETEHSAGDIKLGDILVRVTE